MLFNLVSIRAPARGATSTFPADASLKVVSIRAPARGATCGRVTSSMALVGVSIRAPARRATRLRWTPSFGPKSGLAKVEPAGSVLVVVVSCELGCRPGPGTRNGPTPVRGDGVQVAAGAPRSGVGAERRTWRRSSTPAPGAEAARALMRRGTSTSSHRTRPASDSPTTYAVARHCRSGSSARFPRAPRSANHRGAGRSPHT